MAMDAGIAGVLGRPDLAGNWGAYQAMPVVGARSDGMNGSGISGAVNVSGDVATGQASLGLAASLLIVAMILYFATRGMQR